MDALQIEEKSDSWRHHSKSRIALILIILMVLLVLIILLVAYFIKKNTDPCTTAACKEQASKLLRSMNFNVHPCEDFYKFVCGNILKANKPENFYTEINEREKQNLLELYKDGVKKSEHKMVTFSKRLFNECMNENGIEKDNLTSIKRAIKEAGGWPVLNTVYRILESDFNWLQAAYKLRELGYPFSFLLTVDVRRDWENNFYLRVLTRIPLDENAIMREYGMKEALSIMVDVAKSFGAKNEILARNEMLDVFKFWTRLDATNYKFAYSKPFTVEQFQEKYDQVRIVQFSWLEFLNKIVGTKIVINANDTVWFNEPLVMSEWISLVSNTPNRTVGNYLIWKVIEVNAPYLTRKVQNIMNHTTKYSREEFCLKQTDNMFFPSPIRIINARNVLSAEKIKDAQAIFFDIKDEFLELFEQVNWATKVDKRKIKGYVQTLKMIYGLPGDYFGDDLLDQLDLDLVATRADTFIEILSQANRNLQTALFRQIKSPISNDIMSKFYIQDEDPFKIYKIVENFNLLPVVPAELADYLERDIPKYSKYPGIGMIFSKFFVATFYSYGFEFGLLDKKIARETYEARVEISDCLPKQMNKYNLADVTMEIATAQGNNVAEKVSYNIYEKWVQIHGQERKLPGLNYTPRQLFWITSTYCHVPDANIKFELFNDIQYYARTTLASKINNPAFAKDFNCPLGSKMNPEDKCPELL